MHTRKRIIIIALIVLMALAMTGTAYAGAAWATIRMKDNQTITISCSGDEFIIDFGNGQQPEMSLTCRTWLVAEE